MAKFCPQCGEAREEQTAFCTQCGVSYAEVLARQPAKINSERRSPQLPLLLRNFKLPSRWRVLVLMAIGLAAVIGVGSLTGILSVFVPKKPGHVDLRASVSSTVAGYSVKNMDCETFADKSQESGGRASCRGTLELDFDLYSPLTADAVRASLVMAGIPQAGADFFLRRHPKTFFTKTLSQGDETPFLADCSYFGVVEGWSISCNTNYERFDGTPFATLGNDAILEGSPQHAAFTNDVLSDYRRLDAAFLVVKNGIERFFARGNTVQNADGTISAAMVSPLVWTGERGFLGYQSQFQMQTKYQDRRANGTSTFCGYPKGTPRDDILFEGGINFSRDRETGEAVFPAYAQISDRASQYQNRFSGCGNRLSWNGVSFRGGYSGTAELRSQ